MTPQDLLYLLLMLLINLYTIMMVFRGTYTGVNPIAWFYGEEGVSGRHPIYMRAVFVGGGFFLVSILYYFTQIRYRSLGVMLCTLFPFVFYAKRGDIMPEIMITLILTLFLAVMVHNRRIDPAKGTKKLGRIKIDRAYLASFAVFISVTAAVALSIHKPTYRSQLEKSADFFDTLFFRGAGNSGYEDTSRSSSTRRGGFSYNSNPLFYVWDGGAGDIYYLRRQVFGRFNGSVWENNPYNYWRMKPYSLENPEYSPTDILADAAAVFDTEAPAPEEAYDKIRLKPYDSEFHSTYLPAPYGTITDDEPEYSLKYYKYQPTSDIMRIRVWSETPKVLNDPYDFLQPNARLLRYVSKLDMTGPEYVSALQKDGSEQADRLLADYTKAQNEYSGREGITPLISELADRVTADAHSDWDKALALERYFEKEHFTYSTEYVPPDDSIDYFLTESKTGYCAGYATAMTLMARSVGLTARYVEGFAAFERMPAGEIIVREGYAHAFVEVYIPGAGWMTFDPTVSDYRNLSSDTGRRSGGFPFYFLFLLSRFFIVFIVAAFLIFVVLFDRIKEVILRTALRFMPLKKRVLLLYAHLIRLIEFSAKDDYSAYTVKMLRGYIADTRGAVPEKLLCLFEKTAFGGYMPSAAEYAEAYAEYKKCYKYLRKIPKQPIKRPAVS